MKSTFSMTAVQNGAKRISMGLLFAFAVMFPHQDATAQPVAPNLGTASTFAILAGSAITDVAISSSIIGDVGVHPGAANDLLAAQVSGGRIYQRPADDVALNQAKVDLGTAFVDASTRGVTPGGDFGAITDNQLGGKILVPGVYRFPTASTANLIGVLTLDGTGFTDPVWIFQGTADFVAANASSVLLLGGADACDVFWQITSSATIGTTATMVGIIMAEASITMNNGATLNGSALAQSAAVTLNNNDITVCAVPEPGTMALLGTGLVTLFAFRRRFFSRA